MFAYNRRISRVSEPLNFSSMFLHTTAGGTYVHFLSMSVRSIAVPCVTLCSDMGAFVAYSSSLCHRYSLIRRRFMAVLLWSTTLIS